MAAQAMVGEGGAAKRVLLVGCGRMGGALLQAWVAEGVEVCVVTEGEDPPLGRRIAYEDLSGLPPFDAAVIAVKPGQVATVLASLAPGPRPALLISIAAGLTLANLAAGAWAGARFVRAMPNTAAAVRRSVTALAAGDGVDEADRALTEALFGAAGATVWLDETQVDAATALFGSGPAYFYRLGEALARAGAAMGLPPETALDLARRTLAGAGALADDAAAEGLAGLREAVTSPNGTTAAALGVYDRDGALDDLVAAACAAAATRAEQISGEFDRA